MDQAVPFTISVDHNENIAETATGVEAILTITAAAADTQRPVSAAQVLLIDNSWSMNGRKLRRAKAAAAAAIGELPDGALFGVVAGSEKAVTVFPGGSTLAVASDRTRAKARRAVNGISCANGTAMSTWLKEANRLLRRASAETKHAILLTDGENLESSGRLRRVLQDCRDNFVCDARGIGFGWKAKELRLITETLQGTADGLTDPGELAAEFARLTTVAMNKVAASVALRLWTPPGVRIDSVEQVWPQARDLTGTAVDAGNLTRDYPLGSWGAESRDYRVTGRFPDSAVDDELLLARASVVADGRVQAQALITVQRTANAVLTAALNPRVAHYRGQLELAEAIRTGLTALKAGNGSVARDRLGQAVRLATASGHNRSLEILSEIVVIEDPASGRVRLKAKASGGQVEVADLRAATTVRAVSRSREPD